MSLFLRHAFLSLALFSTLALAAPPWTAPVSPVQSHGWLALGNRLHLVGHNGSNLVHRSSVDNGATWDSSEIALTVIGGESTVAQAFPCANRIL